MVTDMNNTELNPPIYFRVAEPDLWSGASGRWLAFALLSVALAIFLYVKVRPYTRTPLTFWRDGLRTEGYADLGEYFRIPLRLHWSVLLLPLWILLFSHDLSRALLGSYAYLCLLVVHEFGHAWVVRRVGAVNEHIELHIFHGACYHRAVDTPLKNIAVAWGGVGAQAVVLALSLALIAALDLQVHGGRSAHAPFYVDILWIFTVANLVMIIINLLPFAPLDGKTAWRILRYRRRPRQVATPQRQKPKPQPAAEADKVVYTLLERLRERNKD